MVFGFLRRKRDLSHTEARELLSSYADRRLEAGQVAEVEAHLQGCALCRNELESIRVTQRLMQLLPAIRPPRSFAIEAAPKPAPLPRGFLYLRGATGVAAAAFVALLAIQAILPMAGFSLWDSSRPKDVPAQVITAQADAPAKPAAAEAVRAEERLSKAGAQTQSAPMPQPAPTTVAAAPAAPLRAVAPTAAAGGIPETPVAAVAPAPPPAEAAPAGAAPAAAPRAAPKAQAPAAAPAAGAVPAPPPATNGSDQTDLTSRTDLPRYGVDAAAQDQGEIKKVEKTEAANKAEGPLPVQPRLAEGRTEGNSRQAEAGGISTLLPGLLAVTGILVAVLAAATSVVWWRYRRPSQ